MAVDKKGLGTAQREFRDSFKKRVRKHNLLQFMTSFIVFFIGVIIVGMFSVGIFRVNGDGMAPEIAKGRYVVANRLAYVVHQPSRGDVVLTDDGLIRRIVGMPGEKITFNGGFIYANGTVLNESDYLGVNGKNQSVVYSNEEYVIPEGEYMVFCDDRDCFKDSRENGMFITTAKVKGKIFFAF